MVTYSGIAASNGIAIGPTLLFHKEPITVDRCPITDAASELSRLPAAVEKAKQQLDELFKKARKEVGEKDAEIFQAHISMLEDPELIGMIENLVTEQHINLEAAVWDAAEHYAQLLSQLEGEYFQARAVDVRDVGLRLVAVLQNKTFQPQLSLSKPSIILAKDLTPSDTVQLDKTMVLGFCTVEGGETSHTAILARSLGLAAVVGCPNEILELADGSFVILDGNQGKLYVDPDKALLDEYQKRLEAAKGLKQRTLARCHEPAVTKDGKRVEVVANIGNVQGAKTAIQHGAEGVGLLRTEFLYLERATMPDEEEQVQAYREIVTVFGKMPVVLRTSDIGGDKEIPYLNLPREMNPFLGERGLRLCLTNPQLFKPQLKAALRAGEGFNLKIMFPMVTVEDEIHQAKQILDQCKEELRKEGKTFAADVEVGIMVEVPSAAIMADKLAPIVDFFSIGTNDLTQYTLAVDRTNPHLIHLASAFAPAVLRLIRMVIDSAHTYGKWVGVCGELAGEPLAIPILLGMGLDEFSMNPIAVPLAKHILRSLDVPIAKRIAERALTLPSAEAVKTYVREEMQSLGIEID